MFIHVVWITDNEAGFVPEMYDCSCSSTMLRRSAPCCWQLTLAWCQVNTDCAFLWYWTPVTGSVSQPEVPAYGRKTKWNGAFTSGKSSVIPVELNGQKIEKRHMLAYKTSKSLCPFSCLSFRAASGENRPVRRGKQGECCVDNPWEEVVVLFCWGSRKGSETRPVRPVPTDKQDNSALCQGEMVEMCFSHLPLVGQKPHFFSLS